MSEPNSPGRPTRLLGAAAIAAVSVLAQAGSIAQAAPGAFPAIAGLGLGAPTNARTEPFVPAAAGSTLARLAAPLLHIPPERTGVEWEPPPAPVDDRSEYGDASWYGPGFHGRTAASGETFDASARTVAHRTLPIGTIVEIENLESGQTAIARVNDRGPFVDGRIVDCSWALASELGFLGSGVIPVRLSVVDSIVPAAAFDGAAHAAVFPWEDAAPSPREIEPEIEVAAAPADASAAPDSREVDVVRQASVLPFPAIVHASHSAYDWILAQRSWFRAPQGVRARVRGLGLRTFVRLFSF